jgi:rubredoxin
MLRLNPEKKLNVCPNCHSKTKFASIGVKDIKGKPKVVLGRYECPNCDWKSDPIEPDLRLATLPKKPKKPVYLHSHYFKEDKMLFVSVYTTEKAVDPSEFGYMDLDRHLLTVEVTPHSLRIWPNVPFSLPNKRLEEGLLFLQDNKELMASLCAECSEEQKRNCLRTKEPCKKIDKDVKH